MSKSDKKGQRMMDIEVANVWPSRECECFLRREHTGASWEREATLSLFFFLQTDIRVVNKKKRNKIRL